jgi:1,4-alpha-glucan branching enzyme
MPASQRPGMGAIPFAGGVAFRVWAPFASSVNVAGVFNNWNTQASPLTSEGNGYWSGDLATAALNDQYKFVVTNTALPTPLWKIIDRFPMAGPGLFHAFLERDGDL